MAKRTVNQVKTLEPRRTVAGNGPRPPGGDGRGSGWGGGGAAPAATGRVGLWFFLTAVTMLFIAFTVSYAARRTAPDWTTIVLPPILWVNTGLLVASGVALEWARRRFRRGDAAGLRRGLVLTTVLGGAFLVGQVTAWRDLAAAGVFMASSPHSAFFYLLTAVHGLHLLGGLGALGYALRRTAPVAGGPGMAAATAGSTGTLLQNVALYWHFLTALWLYVFVIVLS